MSRGACAAPGPALAAALAVLGACRAEGPPIQAEDLAVRVEVGAHEVEFGRAFELRLVRVWRRELVPEPWPERALAPLALEVVATHRREDADRIEETRVCLARAFAAGTLTVAPATVSAAPRGGGARRTARSEPLVLQVASALPAGASPEPELPGDLLLPRPRRWPWWLAGCAVALGGAALLFARARRRPPPPATSPTPAQEPGRDARSRARARLVRLRAAAPGDAAAVVAFCVELGDLLREYLAEGFALPALERTSEELLAALAATPRFAPEPVARLRQVLLGCDLAKFAHRPPDAAGRARLLDLAERVVEEVHEERAGSPRGAEAGA
ncbi:MAG: hypothetical protein IT458_12305 [Planctomycetes bacterium]|nr:hypothetical protein [Planctomycetota bacterium]